MKTIAKEVIPTRRTIKARFDRRLGGVSKLFDPISELLAEESEKILLETWQKPEPKVNEEVLRIKQVNFRTNTRYWCTSCRKNNIFKSHNYCPHCGTKIEWINPYKIEPERYQKAI